MADAIICDRCGEFDDAAATIIEQEWSGSRYTMRPKKAADGGDVVDLCKDCAQSLVEWFDLEED